MLYSILKPLLFKLAPETAHHASLLALKIASSLGGLKQQQYSAPTTIMGLPFSNPVGLAAGLDKNADYFHALRKLGFGFIEVGTVTPKPQKGNPKPRLFRLPHDLAIRNCLGFNNKGVDYLVEQVKHRPHYSKQNQAILGINIGKNFDVPNDKAHHDYCYGLERVYPYADYVTINISSPNTQNIRELQQESALKILLDALKQKQLSLQQQHRKAVPLLLKIAPDIDTQQIKTIAKTIIAYDIDGMIATNTALAPNQPGGLSGKPIFDKSTHVLKQFHTYFNGKIPIIGLGGIMTGTDAKKKFEAGASLIQLYTGLIYRGPSLIKECVEHVKV